MAEIVSHDERVKLSRKLIDVLGKNAGTLTTEEFILLIYNNAIEDCVAALNVYAEKNPSCRNCLSLAAVEINDNWPLVTK